MLIGEEEYNDVSDLDTNTTIEFPVEEPVAQFEVSSVGASFDTMARVDKSSLGGNQTGNETGPK